MPVDDAEPGDIYVDGTGKLWRIRVVYREPTVEAEEVEGRLNDPNAPKYNPQMAGGMPNIGAIQMPTMPMRASIEKETRKGFTGSTMWDGWKRIFRRPQPIKVAADAEMRQEADRLQAERFAELERLERFAADREPTT